MSDIADRIAQGFQTGFAHPTDPQNQPPILTMAFRTTGLDPDTAQAVDEAAHMLGEAITAAIETDHVIVPRADYERIKADASGPARSVAVHCHCDTGRTDPLLNLSVRGPTSVVDGPAVLRGLARRPVECPHKLVDQ